jgi:programmed cell death protein 5
LYKYRFVSSSTLNQPTKFSDIFSVETMADSELDALRAKRLAELQQQAGPQRPTGSDPNDRNSGEEQRQKQEDMRNTMLSSLLTQEARARLNTIALTKPEKGRMVEDILIQNARRGAFGGGKVIQLYAK